MPLIKKRKRCCPFSEDECLPRSKKSNESYHILDNIGYKDDHHHALYRNVPHTIEDAATHIAKNVVSLLNGDGGILVYGVRPNGTIYGEEITRREQDVLTNSSVDNAIKKIIPCVPVDLYSIIYNDVIEGGVYAADDRHLKVVRIKVAQGRPGEIYEDIKHEVYQRRGTSIYGPYTPHEIKNHTIKQIKEQIRSQARQKLVAVLDTPQKKSNVSSQPSNTGRSLPMASKSKDSHQLESGKTLQIRSQANEKRAAILDKTQRTSSQPKTRRSPPRPTKHYQSESWKSQAITAPRYEAPPPYRPRNPLSSQPINKHLLPPPPPPSFVTSRLSRVSYPQAPPPYRYCQPPLPSYKAPPPYCYRQPSYQASTYRGNY